MKLVTNAERFDNLQSWYVGEIIERTKADLMEVGLKKQVLKDVCGSIAFSTCALIDGSASFEVDGEEYSSFLAFSKNEEEMFYPGGNS